MGLKNCDNENENNYYNIFVGSATGLLKGINVEKKLWKNINSQTTLSKERSIDCLAWSRATQKSMVMGLGNRVVQLYDRDSCSVSKEFNVGGDPIVGVGYEDGKLTTCSETGLLKVMDDTCRAMKQLSVGSDVSVMRADGPQGHVATAGKQNDLKVWDLTADNDTPIFKAKNVRHDWLNLEVPIWIRDLQFIRETSTIVTCTAHHQIRVYDIRTQQRRPTIDISFDEYPLTALSVCANNYQVVSGNSHGTMALFDLRGNGHMVHKFKDFAGGIRSIVAHSSRDLVVSCGLDRYLRIHNISQKKLVNKFYLKSQLNAILFAEDMTFNEMINNTEIKVEDEEEEDVVMPEDVEVKKPVRDDLWDSIEDQSKKRKRGEPAPKKTKKQKKAASIKRVEVIIEDTALTQQKKKIKLSTEKRASPDKRTNKSKKRKIKD